MTPVLPIHGTWSADFTRRQDVQWWEPGSPFVKMMREHGLDAAHFEPFRWSGEISGIERLYPWNWFRRPELLAWRAGGQALNYLLNNRRCPVRVENVNIVAHSHGGQCALMAAAEGLKIRRLLTVGTPIRADMHEIIAAARPNIESWWHVCDPSGDKMQLLGGIGDGRFGVRQRFKEADRNVLIPGAGHSSILTWQFSAWRSHGLAAFLHGDQVKVAA